MQYESRFPGTGAMVIADDYGLGAGHDAVIRGLLRNRAISGTSVLVHDGLGEDRVTELLAAAETGGGRIGLHLNLTLALPGVPSLGSVSGLLGLALRPQGIGRERRSQAQLQLAAQFDRFTTLFGRLPDFADGHEHVIAVPAISGALIDVVRGRSLPRGFWVRSPCPSSLAGLRLELRAGGPKALVIAAIGADFRRRLNAAGIATNEDFSGIVRLDRPDGLARHFAAILDRAADGSVIMVHPGDPEDPVQVPGHLPQARGTEARLLEAALQEMGALHHG